MNSIHNKRHAFTLAELAIGLVFAGLMAGLFLKVSATQSPSDCVEVTKAQLETIRQSMYKFVESNDRLPMPSQRNIGVNNPLFGREASAANLTAYNDGTKDVVTFGALPYQALGLSPSFASDCWGNKFTYAVTTDLTDPIKFKNSTAPIDGNIQIAPSRDMTPGQPVITDTAAFAVISHGANGSGAAPANGDRAWCPDAGTTLEGVNCIDPAKRGDGEANALKTRLVVGAYNDGSNPNDANRFDDLVVYGGKSPRIIDGKVMVDGAGNQVKNQCEQGKLINVVAGPCTSPTVTNFNTWQCQGLNGGATAPGSVPTVMCPPVTCPSPWDGRSYHPGDPLVAYSAVTAPDCVAVSQTKTCRRDGTFGFSPEFIYEKCDNSSCLTPWGETVPDGTDVTAYASENSNDCRAQSQTAKCTNGSLPLRNGFKFKSCTGPDRCGTADNSFTFRLPAPPSTPAELCEGGTASAVTHDTNTPPRMFNWSCGSKACSAAISYKLSGCASGGGTSTKPDAQARLMAGVQSQIGVPYNLSGDANLIRAMDWAMTSCLMRSGNVGRELTRQFGTYTARCDFERVGGPANPNSFYIGLEVCPGAAPVPVPLCNGNPKPLTPGGPISCTLPTPRMCSIGFWGCEPTGWQWNSTRCIPSNQNCE